MLEHLHLHVAHWTRDASAGSPWLRPIADAGGAPLGFVRFAGRARGSWFSWLRGLRLDVYETEDASHLMTLIRPWGMFRIWDVYDADEVRIGSIYPPSLVDSDGERRAFLNLLERDRGTFLDPQRNVLGSFSNGTALEMSFTPDPAGNPFLRMLLLAAALSQDPQPTR